MVTVIHMRTIRRILSMSDAAWEVVTRAMQLTCFMLFCAFVLLIDAGTYTAGNSYSYRLAYELALLPQAVLLLATIASAVIEERSNP